MGILREPKSWRRDVPHKARRSPDHLTAEEGAHVRRALLFLRVRHGGMPKLAVMLGIGKSVVERACLGLTKPSAGVALRAARLAGEPVERLLRGEWPSESACPHCGRT
jgi:hypothetical protein